MERQMLVIDWKKGAPAEFRKHDAAKAHAELLSVAVKYGALRPDYVVKEAEKPESYLHRFFCWDDKKAAHEYRKHQARQLINSIEIIVIQEKEQPKKTPAFYNTYTIQESPTLRPKREYVPIQRISRDSTLAVLSIRSLAKQLKGVSRRIVSLIEALKQNDPDEYQRYADEFEAWLEMAAAIQEQTELLDRVG